MVDGSDEAERLNVTGAVGQEGGDMYGNRGRIGTELEQAAVVADSGGCVGVVVRSEVEQNGYGQPLSVLKAIEWSLWGTAWMKSGGLASRIGHGVWTWMVRGHCGTRCSEGVEKVFDKSGSRLLGPNVSRKTSWFFNMFLVRDFSPIPTSGPTPPCPPFGRGGKGGFGPPGVDKVGVGWAGCLVCPGVVKTLSRIQLLVHGLH